MVTAKPAETAAEKFVQNLKSGKIGVAQPLPADTLFYELFASIVNIDLRDYFLILERRPLDEMTSTYPLSNVRILFSDSDPIPKWRTAHDELLENLPSKNVQEFLKGHPDLETKIDLFLALTRIFPELRNHPADATFESADLPAMGNLKSLITKYMDSDEFIATSKGSFSIRTLLEFALARKYFQSLQFIDEGPETNLELRFLLSGTLVWPIALNILALKHKQTARAISPTADFQWNEVMQNLFESLPTAWAPYQKETPDSYVQIGAPTTFNALTKLDVNSFFFVEKIMGNLQNTNPKDWLEKLRKNDPALNLKIAFFDAIKKNALFLQGQEINPRKFLNDPPSVSTRKILANWTLTQAPGAHAAIPGLVNDWILRVQENGGSPTQTPITMAGSLMEFDAIAKYAVINGVENYIQSTNDPQRKQRRRLTLLLWATVRNQIQTSNATRIRSPLNSAEITALQQHLWSHFYKQIFGTSSFSTLSDLRVANPGVFSTVIKGLLTNGNPYQNKWSDAELAALRRLHGER